MEKLLEVLADIAKPLVPLVIISIFCERFTEYITLWVVDTAGKWMGRVPDRAFWAKLSVLVLGCVISLLAQLDMFSGLINFVHPAVGLVMTAFVIGGGTEFLHQMIGAFARIGR